MQSAGPPHPPLGLIKVQLERRATTYPQPHRSKQEKDLNQKAPCQVQSKLQTPDFKFPLITTFYRGKLGTLTPGAQKTNQSHKFPLPSSLPPLCWGRAGGGGDPTSTLTLNLSMLGRNMLAYSFVWSCYT